MAKQGALFRPYVHAICYAPAGAGKSFFAATWPKPMLVLSFDPVGKTVRPYYSRGNPLPEVQGDVGQGLVLVESKKNPGRTIIQLEYFHDDELKADGELEPVAYPRFLSRLPSLYDEVRAGMWMTVVIDSLTAMKLATRNLHQFKLNKGDKDDRRFDKLATDDLEQALCCRLVSLRCNLVLLAHVDKDKDEVAGAMVNQIAMPGRLAKSDGLASRYPEMYTIRRERDTKDRSVIRRWLQTQPDAAFNCMSTQLDAPDHIAPDYKNLWLNYDALHGEGGR